MARISTGSAHGGRALAALSDDDALLRTIPLTSFLGLEMSSMYGVAFLMLDLRELASDWVMVAARILLPLRVCATVLDGPGGILACVMASESGRS